MSRRIAARCPKCGDQYTGKQEHCMSCHTTFAGTTAGDSHRHGPFEPRLRRCRSAAEMKAGGMWATISQHGTTIWHGEWNAAGIQRRRQMLAP